MIALLSALLLGSAATVVISPAPEAVSVTVYRDPSNRANGGLDPASPTGSALVTETRTVDLPAGPADIRFEGVADGIVPVSAIITGLPGGTVEKNRDARLLSPRALADGTLGRHVTLHRTDRASGRVVEEDGRIVAGPAGGIVVQTAAGFVALGCSGLAERPVYDGVPEGLSARPTLSVTTVSPVATQATVQLSYLADDFDWEANYIARIGADGRTLDLFAWLTLANGNGVGFRDAQTMAVAGRLEQADGARNHAVRPEPATLRLRCWPRGTTSDIPVQAPPPPPPPPPAAPMAAMDSIMVTARRREERLQDVPMAVLMAQQENLGDLKLYRIPEPVTVAAHSQKQVALLTRRAVPFETIYGFLAEPRGDEGRDRDPQPARIILRLHNREKDGLGLPLPAGRIAVMAPHGEHDLNVGEGDVADTAIGQEANLSIGTSAQVRAALTPVDAAKGRWRFEIANAYPHAVRVEAVIGVPGQRLRGAIRTMERRNGLPLWSVEVPANGRRVLNFDIAPVD